MQLDIYFWSGLSSNLYSAYASNKSMYEQTHLSEPYLLHGSHRLEKYFILKCFLEKSLKIKSAWKNTGKSLKSLETSLNSTIFCRT